MIVRVRYSVTFTAEIEVPDDATHQQIGKELADLHIPEDENSKYLVDSFEPETDNHGNPQLFDRNWIPISLEQARTLEQH